MSILDELTASLIKFRDNRDWKQFHSPKNLAESLVLEASEVLEHFQWKNDAEIESHIAKHKKEFSHELADVLNYLLLIAEATGVNIEKAAKEKLKISSKKYPISKSKGKATKYTKL